jgi:hypothetical protein
MYDGDMEKETRQLDREMERIKRKEMEVVIMARGLRKIQAEQSSAKQKMVGRTRKTTTATKKKQKKQQEEEEEEKVTKEAF